MSILCEDLAQYGVVLVPPPNPEYFRYLTDIEQRLQSRPGSPPLYDQLSLITEHDRKSAILLNRAPVAIASMADIWWFPGRDGRVVPHSSLPGTNDTARLLFTQDNRANKFHAYWNTIFPGSKRLMRPDGSMLGDNSDVRPPAADELWHGGFVSWGGGSSIEGLEPLKLTLDGVFFVDGGFVGPNRLGAWEHSMFAAEAYLACAALARKARANSEPPGTFFSEVQKFTGQTGEGRMPIPGPPGSWMNGPLDVEFVRRSEFQWVGWNILQSRQRAGDEAALSVIEALADAPVLKLHKL